MHQKIQDRSKFGEALQKLKNMREKKLKLLLIMIFNKELKLMVSLRQKKTKVVRKQERIRKNLL